MTAESETLGNALGLRLLAPSLGVRRGIPELPGTQFSPLYKEENDTASSDWATWGLNDAMPPYKVNKRCSAFSKRLIALVLLLPFAVSSFFLTWNCRWPLSVGWSHETCWSKVRDQGFSTFVLAFLGFEMNLSTPTLSNWWVLMPRCIYFSLEVSVIWDKTSLQGKQKPGSPLPAGFPPLADWDETHWCYLFPASWWGTVYNVLHARY